MSTILIMLQTIILIAIPMGLMWGEKRFWLLQKLSPAFFCYVIGILWGNIPGFRPDDHVLEIALQVSVPLAIPLLLFPTHIPSWLKLAPKALLSFGLWIVVLACCASLGAWLFHDMLEMSHKLAGMVLGVYSGGTPNLAAIHLALGVDEATFIEMNFTDLLLSGTYLILVLTVMQSVFLKWLPPFKRLDTNDTSHSSETAESQTPLDWKSVVITLLLGFAVVGGAIGISFLLKGKIDELIVIIGVSILGLMFALIPFVRSQSASYDVGHYLMLIFCVAVGAKVDLAAFFQNTSIVIGFMALIFLWAILLHFFLARFLRIDADTALITSTAGIFGPPFIGPVADAMNNRDIIPTGMTLGVMGLALGNLLGIGLSWVIAYFL